MRRSARRIIVIVVAVLLSIIVVHYDDFLPYRWQTFTAPDGRFSVRFPAKPEVADRQVKSATGEVVLLDQVTAIPSRSTSYFCVHYDDPRLASEPAERVLNSSRDSSIANVQGHLVSERRLEVAGHPVRDIEARTKADSILDIRLVATGHQIFALMVVETARRNPDSKNIAKFFDSLRLSD